MRRAVETTPAPLVIAHRGACGLRPEHTLEAYSLAIDQGADFIEPDLVSTKDGVLVARHENEIGGTTDVSRRFPDRRCTRRIDGIDVRGWFTEDFSLSELQSLRARERLPFRSKAFDGQFEIPTFDEVIALAQRRGRELGRVIGVYPETKHPGYFRGIGLPLEEALLATLQARGWYRREDPVFIQSFEVANLRHLRTLTALRLVQLVDERGGPADQQEGAPALSYAAMVTRAGLLAIATYADAVGVHRRLIVPVTPEGRLQTPTPLIRRAHDAGLLVHVWTLRSEREFLAAAYEDAAAEYRQFADLGVDGIFTDFTADAVAALRPAPR